MNLFCWGIFFDYFRLVFEIIFIKKQIIFLNYFKIIYKNAVFYKKNTEKTKKLFMLKPSVLKGFRVFDEIY